MVEMVAVVLTLLWRNVAGAYRVRQKAVRI